MHAHDVQVLFDLDVLVSLGHTAWKGPMHETGDPALAPQARVGAAQTHDGYRLWSTEALALARRMPTISWVGSQMLGAL